MPARLLALAALWLASTGIFAAASSEPIANFQNLPVKTRGDTPSLSQVRAAIVAAGRKRNWVIVEGEPGQLRGTLLVRGKHRAEIDIAYSPQSYSVIYRNSESLNYDGQNIHPSYNRWVKDLIFNIESVLATVDGNPSAAVPALPQRPAVNPAPAVASGNNSEVSFWESVRNSGSAVELQAYLDQYPSGTFAPLARARLAALAAPAASRASTAPAATTSLSSISPGPPQAGDSWTYRLSFPRLRGEFGQIPGLRVPRIFVARVASVSDSEIVDELSVDGQAVPAVRHGKGGYLVEQGVSVFSPYLAVFINDLSQQTRLGAVEIFDPGCGPKYFCEAKARIAGIETISVAAGRFTAIRITVEEAWRPVSSSVVGTQSAGMNGGRMLTAWYVPELKRAVKYASRRTVGDLPPIEPTFDLELVSYRLK